MSSIDRFLTNVYSEELYQVSEAEYDEVMRLAAEDDFSGYSDWADSLPFTEGDVENFVVLDGKVCHKPQPPERERIGGIEV
jgi:hypothetical protein